MINLNKKIKVDITSVVLIIAFIIMGLWSYVKKISLDTNTNYTIGLITGIHEGSKGTMYLDYQFQVNNKIIKSSVPLSVCPTCTSGDSILVKFDHTNIANNGIAKKKE